MTQSSVLSPQHSVLDDLETGETPLTLGRAARDSRLCVNGKPRGPRWLYRATTGGCRGADGARVVLETITQSGLKITTAKAIGRFIARQAMGQGGSQGGTGSLPMTPATAHKAHQAAKQRLAAAGI